MPEHDFRTKPGSAWSFYVVDDLVTMANLYRYDTVQEAIDKYKTLPKTLRSAIGSSIGQTFAERHEIDHIHQIDGISVLVRDMDRMEFPLWRESKEISEAVARMRSQLHVEYELSSVIFPSSSGSIAVPLSSAEPKKDSYFNDKQLDPIRPDRPLSGISEVHVTGRGWVDILTFLQDLDDRQWSPKTGYPVPFVNQLNIRYVDKNGHFGQADIAPEQFQILRDEYLKAMERKPDLDTRIADAGTRASGQTTVGKEKKTIMNEIEEGRA